MPSRWRELNLSIVLGLNPPPSVPLLSGSVESLQNKLKLISRNLVGAVRPPNLIFPALFIREFIYRENGNSGTSLTFFLFYIGFSSTQGVLHGAKASYWESYYIAKCTCLVEGPCGSMGLMKGKSI